MNNILNCDVIALQELASETAGEKLVEKLNKLYKSEGWSGRFGDVSIKKNSRSIRSQ